MKLGIVGLPNVGKSTLFNSLTKAGAESANYPFCTIDPNVGVVTVPDERLNVLGEMYHTKKIIPAAIEFVDIAGLVKGASKGEGLGNQFLANIREVDAIVHVVRCFEDSNIVHVDGSIDPLRDIETINLELIFSDLEILERRISKAVRAARNDKTIAKELALMERIKAHLEDGKMAKSFDDINDEDEQQWLESYNLLTYKPVIFAANVAEDDLADDGKQEDGNPPVAGELVARLHDEVEHARECLEHYGPSPGFAITAAHIPARAENQTKNPCILPSFAKELNLLRPLSAALHNEGGCGCGYVHKGRRRLQVRGRALECGESNIPGKARCNAPAGAIGTGGRAAE